MTTSVFQRVAAGDPRGLRECIREHGPLVWSLARRFTRTAGDAEDATQDIFINLWQQAGRYDPGKGTERMFVAIIARRRLIDRWRRQMTEPPTMDTSEPSLQSVLSADPTPSSDTFIDAEHALLLLSRLEPKTRRVLECAFLEGLTHPEIAVALGMPLGSVKAVIRRGLLRIRDAMNGVAPPGKQRPRADVPADSRMASLMRRNGTLLANGTA